MNTNKQLPPIMALFHKRIEGDDALLHLAHLRFRETGMGAEFYAGSLNELDWLLKFQPGTPHNSTVHLPRWINIFDARSLEFLSEFFERFTGRISGAVFHDQREMGRDPERYIEAVKQLHKTLDNRMDLFIEYAVGIPLDLFAEIFHKIKALESISFCLDIGHIGMHCAKKAYSKKRNGKNIFSLSPSSPALPDTVADVEEAVQTSLPALLNLIHDMGDSGKRVHFHLHDGHPLYSRSKYGLTDHLSFFEKIPIPFDFAGKPSLDMMYGISGLYKILEKSHATFCTKNVSYNIEIHPSEGRVPLGNASYLFGHWDDRTNAEKTNYWLQVLMQNHKIISDGLKRCFVEPQKP